jgi:hypothetical protein
MSNVTDEQIKSMLDKKFKTRDIATQLKVGSKRIVQIRNAMEKSYHIDRLNSRARTDSFIMNAF